MNLDLPVTQSFKLHASAVAGHGPVAAFSLPELARRPELAASKFQPQNLNRDFVFAIDQYPED
jgi:hypothetical protein